MMLQSCCTVCASPLSLEKELLLLGIKFRRYAKEEANQQRVTWMDFLTSKKNYAKIFTSFLTGC